MINLKDKNAFITGSSRGIGQQVALGLAELGCNLIIHGRTETSSAKTQDLLKAYPVAVHTVFGDITAEVGVEQIIAQVKALHVPVDILYNNAAIMRPYHANYWEHSWEDWMLTMKANVFSMYSLCAAFVPAMIDQGFGRVVNLISGIKDQPELAPYGASKSAVLKLTEDLAVKVEGTNVRINALDPGWLRTDMGGEHGEHAVEAVLPGALAPTRIENDGPNGIAFFAID